MLQLTVLHVNHALRPEADQEQQLVEDLCRRWQLSCVVKTLTPPQVRGGIEAWARAERYQFFQQAKEQYCLDAVALAHTRDDQAETVLFRLLRGTGRRGLAGIPARRDGWVIRPLLSCSRQEIVAYLATKQLPYATDASNTDLRYTRNKIRHMLLPLLEREFSPQIRQHLVQTAESLRQEETWIEEQVQSAYERVQAGENRLSSTCLLAEPQALLPRIFRIWLERSKNPTEVGFLHLQRLCALAEGKIVGQVELPGTLVVRREGNFLVLAKKHSHSVVHSYRYHVTFGESLKIPETGWEIDASWPVAWNGTLLEARLRDPWLAVFDLDTLSEPLMVRSCEPGDRMRPLGMQGQKKIHDIFIDKKIVVVQRRLWPLVLCGAEIIWVPGCVRGERGKVTAATQRVCWFTVNPLPENEKLC
jgi:tRNA(Ile)-lysidine synthase